MILAEAIGEKGFLSLEDAEKEVRRRKMHYNRKHTHNILDNLISRRVCSVGRKGGFSDKPFAQTCTRKDRTGRPLEQPTSSAEIWF